MADEVLIDLGTQIKFCPRCKANKPIDEFYRSFIKKRNRFERHCYCRTCNHQGWNPKNNRKRKLMEKFRMTVDEYIAMEKLQDGRCAICGQKETKVDHQKQDVLSLSVDHCHVTGKIRGLLCGSCNFGIGHLKDNPDIVRKAAEYLERHRQITQKPVDRTAHPA